MKDNGGEAQKPEVVPVVVGTAEQSTDAPTATTTRLYRLLDDFSTSSVEAIEDRYPGITERLKACLASINGMLLDRDLEIRMPRLEEVDLARALATATGEAGDGEGSLSDDICRYVSLLAQFNNYVGQGLEDSVVAWLNEHAAEWRPAGERCFFARNTVQFPDVVLLEPDPSAIGKYRILFHVEVKTWYVFARDLITARFHTAPNCIKRDALLVVFPWYMTEVVYGVPHILAPLAYNARELAVRRDVVWAAGGSRNAAKGIVSDSYKVEVPSEESFFLFSINTQNIKSEAYQLTTGGAWVKDADNFGKIHRFYYEPIFEFERETLGRMLKGHSLSDWRDLLFGS